MDPTAPLRTVDEHARRAAALVAPLPAVELPLDEALGAVLARDLVALLDLPPFDAAAMDGYALRRADAAADVTLRVVGEVAAGSSEDRLVGPGEAVRIMTGAPLPSGTDVVVPVERTSTGTFAPTAGHGVTGIEGTAGLGPPSDDDGVTVPALTPDDRAHLRRRGEDVTAGAVVAPAGTLVSARLAALAAALGHATLPVHRPPVVAVLSTGDELTPAGEPLGPGRIPDSNSVLLAGAVRGAGARALRTGGVPDTPEALAVALDDAVRAGADLLVTTGGVSVGAHDVVRTLLAVPPGDAPGATDVDVAAVGMQPGKPQALARWRGVPWVAAPGNPTGAYASFELFVRPMLARLRGLPGTATGDALDERRVVATGWRSPRTRQQLVPVRIDDGGRVAPVGDGHRLSALALADGLAVVPVDVHDVEAGDTVVVRRFAPAAQPASVTGAEPGVVFDAVVLAGGRAERLGVPKPGVTLAGRTLLDHALAATSSARRTVVVGPPELSRAGVTVVREDPPFGGPVAGLAAGLAALPRPDAGASEVPVLVLACDVPRAHAAVPLLLAAAHGPQADAPDGAYLVRDDRPQWLVGVYARESLDRSLADLTGDTDGGLAGASVRALVAGMRCAEVTDPDALSDDVDTWDDAARLAAALAPDHEPGSATADDPDGANGTNGTRRTW